LSLALRNQVDPNSAETLGATKLTLLPAALPLPVPKAQPKPAAPRPVLHKVAAAAPQRTCITVINGLRPSAECF
jgi:pilus assembly protein CpaB